jgi:hypothetical protein
LWPRFLLIAVLAAIGVVLCVLPASLVARFLPERVQAEDFSGSIWHGSAGRLTAGGRDAGALEWRVHPSSLLELHLVADLHWVKGAFVLDGTADVDRHDLRASNLEGGGPVADLRDFGVAAGWRGTAIVNIKELRAVFSASAATITKATGSLSVSNLSSAAIAGGADLGGYSLQFADTAIAPDADASATLTDTGGPLSLDAVIHISGGTHTGLISGTIQERADTPPALRAQLENLAQMHARDARGRIPVDLEFTF